MTQLHVVIGATGALGAAIVQHLRADELPVRALARNVELAESMLPEETEIVPVDALDPDSVRAGCEGASVIYSGLYVPEKLNEVAATLVSVATATGARLVFPSNTDVYGPPQQVPFPETHPHLPTSPRGKRRAQAEQMMMEAHARGEAQIVIARIASLYGAHIRGSYMASVFENAMGGKKAYWLGNLDVPHNMLYVPDAAAACILLGTASDTAGFAWHITGDGPLTGREFMNKIYTAYGVPPNFAVRSRTMFQVVGTVIPDAKRLLDVMYQFEKPFVMDGSRFATRFPDFVYTAHDVGIQDTADWFKAELGE